MLKHHSQVRVLLGILVHKIRQSPPSLQLELGELSLAIIGTAAVEFFSSIPS